MFHPRRRLVLVSLLLLLAADLVADDTLKKQGWPAGTQRVEIVSTKDQTRQPALVRPATGEPPRPLLVGLHTWSGDYTQAGGETVYARWCQQENWHFIHPDFRGRNRTPAALGSDLAIQDILDAVDYMKSNYPVDPDRVYLVGVSGGGHAALLLAGRAPEVWAGVSAWCPISDIESWWRFHAFDGEVYQPDRYAREIEAAVGGRPDESADSRAECEHRSPLTWLPRARNVNLDINHGLQDGRRGSVPFTHSIWAFNRVAEQSERIPRPQWEAFYDKLELPEGMTAAAADELYGQKQPRFRRTSGRARLTIFEGDHEIIHVAALNWLAHQRRGQPAKWKLDTIRRLPTTDAESRSNR